MPSLRQDIEQDVITETYSPIRKWLEHIAELTRQHNQDMVLYVKSNSPVNFYITSNPDLAMNIEQRYLVQDTEMTLKQWKECLINLSHKFGNDAFLYTVPSQPVDFYLSPIKLK